MSTSLLYHAFGIRGYKYLRTKYEEGAVVFTIEQERQRLRCAGCGSARIIRRGKVLRKLRALPIGGKSVVLVVGDCGR